MSPSSPLLAARGESRAGPACVFVSVPSLSKLARNWFDTASFRRLGTNPMPRRMPARDFRHRLLATDCVFWRIVGGATTRPIRRRAS